MHLIFINNMYIYLKNIFYVIFLKSCSSQFCFQYIEFTKNKIKKILLEIIFGKLCKRNTLNNLDHSSESHLLEISLANISYIFTIMFRLVRKLI